jgi:hypothetical protein
VVVVVDDVDRAGEAGSAALTEDFFWCPGLPVVVVVVVGIGRFCFRDGVRTSRGCLMAEGLLLPETPPEGFSACCLGA